MFFFSLLAFALRSFAPAKQLLWHDFISQCFFYLLLITLFRLLSTKINKLKIIEFHLETNIFLHTFFKQNDSFYMTKNKFLLYLLSVIVTNLVWFLAVVALCYDIKLMEKKYHSRLSCGRAFNITFTNDAHRTFAEGDTE